MRDQIERIYQAINSEDLDALDGLFSDDYLDHAEGHRGVEPFKQQMRMFRAAFPDLCVSIDDTVEAGDRIATRTTVTGTHTGDLMAFLRHTGTSSCRPWTSLDSWTARPRSAGAVSTRFR